MYKEFHFYLLNKAGLNHGVANDYILISMEKIRGFNKKNTHLTVILAVRKLYLGRMLGWSLRRDFCFVRELKKKLLVDLIKSTHEIRGKSHTKFKKSRVNLEK